MHTGEDGSSGGRDERGATLVLVAFGMAIFLGLAALAVDMGLLYTARTESQRVADSAALAGAGGLAQSPGNEALARELARDFAARNTVRKQPVTLLDEDIDVILDSQKVRVRVRHTADRNNAIPTIFARILGVERVDVATVAAAEAAPATALTCALPLAMPDRWLELGGHPERYDEEYDWYEPWDPENPDAEFTGYSVDDIGEEIVIKPNQGGGDANESWYYPWRPPGQQGAEDYRTNINSCVDPSIEYHVGMVVDTEPGAMIGPTLQGFNDLIDQDPDAAWDHGMNCVVDASAVGSGDPAACRASPRLRPMPMFDPTETPDPGSRPFTFTNFTAVFVDRIQGNNVYAIFAGYTGVSPADGGTTAAGPMFRTLRLVE